MSGWYILIVCVVCALGVLAFLRLVANGILLAADAVHQLEDEERKAHERRLLQAGQEATAARPEQPL